MTFFTRFSSKPFYGIAVAFTGALIITPDTVFMRLSGMDALQMLVWRGLAMSGVLFGVWLIVSRGTLRQETVNFFRPRALIVTFCFMLSAIAFTLGIASAPVSIILFGVACAPLFAALFSWLLMSEYTPPLTYVFMTIAMTGIAVAVYEPAGSAPVIEGIETLATGAFFGLSAGACIGLSFSLLRSDNSIPILLINGGGALLAAICALIFALVTGYPLQTLTSGDMLSILISGGIILPMSFFLLGYATRFTAAANVSLFMLLETVLGPLWVWLVVDERPTNQMIMGGVLVVASLIAYLLWSMKRPVIQHS